MAQAGAHYEVVLTESNLDWGNIRYTNTRPPRQGEGYIPIPAKTARELDLCNNNATHNQDVLGVNLFRCQSADGLFTGMLRAQGNTKAGEVHAKNFSVDKDLKGLGDWFQAVNAEVGDVVRLTWKTPTDIIVELVKR